MRWILAILLLFVLSVIGYATSMATYEEEPNRDNVIFIQEPVREYDYPAVVTSSTTTTSVPINPGPKPSGGPTADDDEQLDCQLELGVNFCEDEDFEEFYYGEEW